MSALSTLPLLAAAGTPDYGWLGNTIVAIMEAIGPVGVGLAVFAENIFPPIPSEVILPLAGFTAAGGAFSPHAALIWATVGSVVGALALYGLGAWLGRRRLYRIAAWMPLVDVSDVERTEKWFARYGYWTVFVGRMVPVFRSLISIPAGIERMNVAKFTLFTALGSLLWNAIFVYGGYALGENFHVISDYADMFSNIVMVLILVFLAVWVVLRLRRNRGRAADPAVDHEDPEAAAARVEAEIKALQHRK
ncbi:DedA family protein [Micrococcus porci]|uniref:DedA family protein n=1 Tax=Micrococcus TaxID=1269 RepID=UPI001CCBAF8E|nr:MULTISPECIES: DedA family protein [Micrococcus]MCG7423308.1 DedA family protein [Micrococcus sp. ACRRV]UBH25488.1 DedA family protein [Micrococcus porci]